MLLSARSYIGDCLVPRACADFVQEYGTEIVQRNLCRNVLVHLTNLCDFGLIRADVLSRTTMQLFRLRAKMFADGLLCKATPVPVNSKWDPLRNFSAVPVVTTDCATFPRLLYDHAAAAAAPSRGACASPRGRSPSGRTAWRSSTESRTATAWPSPASPSSVTACV